MKSVKELIERQAANSSDAVFAIDPATGDSITYKQLLPSVQRVATFLEQLGVEPGQSVAFAMSNSPRCAVVVLGIMYGGYRATAINLVAGRTTIGYVLSHSQSQVVLTEAKHQSDLEAAIPTYEPPAESRLVICDDAWWSELHNIKPSESNRMVSADADALLMYTSGTTGLPKGVVLSQKSLVASGHNVTLAHNITEQDRALCVLPLYHINGLCTTVMGPLYSGSSVVYPEKFSTSLFWTWMVANKCSWFSIVPTHVAYLVHDRDNMAAVTSADLANIRFGRSASAPLSPDMQMAFENSCGIPIIETMGLTETAGQILSNPMEKEARKIGSPGVAVGCEVRIADANMQTVVTGDVGEVVVRGAVVLNRYFRNDEATTQAISDDGWFRTGDLGRMDDDGFVFITGRLKELIIKGGENVAPREIDEALYHHPDVIEAAAFACPCQRYGQRIEAAVAMTTGSTVTEEDLLALCEERLGAFKKPDQIHFLPDLPKGPSGKIQRLKLSELFVQNQTPGQAVENPLLDEQPGL